MEQEERNRQTQYGVRIYDETAPGVAIDPHNFADDGGFGNKIFRNTYFDTNGNLRETRKTSIKERFSTLLGAKPTLSKNRQVSRMITADKNEI